MTDFASETVRLLAAARDGDDSALERVLERHAGYVRRIASLHLGLRLRQLYDVDDLVQESMLSALRGLRTLEVAGAPAFRVWLARVVENRIRDLGRRTGAEKRGGLPASISDLESRLLGDNLLRGGEPSPSQNALGHELEGRLETALLELRDAERRVVVLRRVAGLAYSEIATELGFASESVVRGLMSRALARLSKAV